MADQVTLIDDLVVAADRALAALRDEIDLYVVPTDAPMETRLAHDALADALDAFRGEEAEDDAE